MDILDRLVCLKEHMTLVQGDRLQQRINQRPVLGREGRKKTVTALCRIVLVNNSQVGVFRHGSPSVAGREFFVSQPLAPGSVGKQCQHHTGFASTRLNLCQPVYYFVHYVRRSYFSPAAAAPGTNAPLHVFCAFPLP